MRYLVVSIAFVVFVGMMCWGIVYAQQIEVPPGQVAHCVTRFVLDSHKQLATCITQTPTRTVVVTTTPTPSGHPNVWHTPTVNEHGDEPPIWVVSSGLAPTFEGTEAHAGFKGFLFSPVNGVDAYMIIHLISTPSGRMTRYHTYKTWLRDPTGAVSYYYGTVDTGDPLTTRRPLVQGDPGTRPIVLVVDQATYDQMGPVCEVWYTFPTTGGPHINWLICAPVYLHDPTDTTDPVTWTKTPPGNWLGLQREADLVWYDGYQPEGFFAGGYTAPTLKNYATDSGGLKMLFFRNARSYACPNCVVPN